VLLASEGLSNKDIARRLGVTEGSVKIHLHNIYQKLGVTNRTAMTALERSGRNRLSVGPRWRSRDCRRRGQSRHLGHAKPAPGDRPRSRKSQ
jgi:hypothetical protein